MLNPQQKLAIHTTNGAVLVLAGAGSGKTRVLTERIKYILENGLARPWEILALTFTNKAANEMKTRIRDYLQWCGTFHSICLKILRYNYAAAGLHQNFLIFGEDEQRAVLKNIGVKKEEIPDLVEKIARIKDDGIRDQRPETRDQIFNDYNAELSRLNAIDFGDIILKTLELFQNHPEILEKYKNQFKYILVDEFQDTNTAQMQLLTMLYTGNICCVGDDDQSIYSWRGAQIKNILDFEKTFPGTKIIRLEINYRSTGNILRAANSLISNNDDRLGKNLKPYDESLDGERVYTYTLQTDLAEAYFIANAILDINEPNETAILIRNASLSRVLEEALRDKKIPYKLVGGTKFYDRMEIRDAVAYIRLMVHSFDDMSFKRIISKPRRGFGDGALMKLAELKMPFMNALKIAKLPVKQRAAADEFLSAFNFDWKTMPPKDAVEKILNDSGYIKYWEQSKDIDAADRLNNINELIDNVAKYNTLNEFLEHAALMISEENDDESSFESVSIMTIHAAKGLEFNNVFLPAWETGIFPNERSDLNEERRLAYVAMTRAKKRLVITNASSRRLFGQTQYNSPSIFLSEIGNQKFESPISSIQSLVGNLVSHSELGRGVVIEENGEILTIAFAQSGIKKVARKFITFNQ